MEPLGAIFSEFDWNVVDESELTMAQLLGTCQGSTDQYYDASCDWLHNVAASGFYWPSSTDTAASNSNFFFPPTDQFNSNSYEEEKLSDAVMIPAMKNTSSESMMTSTQLPPIDYNNQQFDVASNINITTTIAEHTPPQPKRKIVEHDIGNKDKITIENDPKKKARASAQIQNSAKNARRKKEESNASSEDNSNASQEPIGEGEGDGTSTCNMNGKKRATDPQSLYARKRRERINERLRILQNLVPNGTKVDISTMLEEAVEYVKFLQLQIKLLSSDDMWMYAPLASNGMDIGGLDLKLHFPQQTQ